MRQGSGQGGNGDGETHKMPGKKGENGEEVDIDLEISDWSRIILALCAPKVKTASARKRILEVAMAIAARLAETLGIEPPTGNKQRSRIK
jgi:hypothetical protein